MGSQTGGGVDQTPLEERCEPKGPYEEGQVCYYEEVSCLNGKRGLALSRCKAGECVGAEACGIILSTEPKEIPKGTTPSIGQQPAPTPSVGGISNPIPSTPSTPTAPSGSGSGSGSGTGGSGGGFDADSNMLPPIEVVQDADPVVPSNPTKPPPGWLGSGNTFSTAPSIVNPSPSNAAGNGVYSGGNPFTNPSGTTFTGSWGTSSGVSGNLFSNLISGIANLFSGLFGGGSGSVYPSAKPSQPSYSPRPVPQTPSSPTSGSGQTIDEQPLPDQLKEFLEALENGTEQPKPLSPLDLTISRDRNGFSNTPQSTDRSGISLDDVLESLTGGQNQSPSLRLFPSGIDNPSVWEPLEPPALPRPTVPAPSGGSGRAQGSGNGTALPPSERPTSRFAAELAVSEARAALDTRSSYERFLDRINIGSPQTVAYAQSLQNLAALTKEESLQYLAQAQYRLGVQVAEGGPVMTDAGSIADIEAGLSPEQRARFEAQYDEFVQKFDAAESDAEREQIVREYMDKTIRDAQAAIDPATRAKLEKDGITFTPPASPPVRSVPERSGLLAGLSDVGKKAVDAIRDTWRSLFSPQHREADMPPPVPVTPPSQISPPNPDSPPAPTQNPNSPPRPQPTLAPTAAQGGGFVQSSVNFLSTLLQGLLSIFINSSDPDSGRTSSASEPPDPSPAASITANPSLINDGDTSIIAWSSVRSSKCVLVDAALNVIAEGLNGTTTSPALSESTRFGIICDIDRGVDKFVNETLVRVRGDETDPLPIFSHSGSVSQATGNGASTITSSSNISGGTNVDTNIMSVAPVDVRTCDPDQSMDSFIRCLCEAEPNPAGCTIPPGGLYGL